MENRWTERISDYVDGTMDADEVRVFEARMDEDPDLAAAVADVRALVRDAAALPPVDPPAGLWTAIAGDLPPRGAAGPVVDLQEERARRGMVFARWQAIAAAVTLALLSGAMGWILRGEPAPSDGPPTTARGPAVETGVWVDEAVPARFDEENAHLAANIHELEVALRAQRGRLDEETLAVVEDNLAAIDEAIRDALRALGQDPDSSYLRSHLASTMERKARLLEDANRLSRREI